MKNTSLYDVHVRLGAKMVPFAGFNMPVSYTGIKAEHQAVREALGMFDVSHMGEFLVKGEQALDFLQYVTSNDVAKLEDGKVQYSCLPNGEGGIVDDLLVYRMNAEKYLLVVNASNMEKDWNWLQKQNKWGVQLEDLSDNLSLLAVQGPKAVEALQALTSVDLSTISYYSFVVGDFAGVQDVIISATGYTGAGGFELYVTNADAAKVWEAVMQAGAAHGILPCGLGCRDTLRLEMGYCLYGNDINDTTSPLEAGLGWITKFTKDFIDADKLQAQKAAGLQKKLVGFEMQERGIPRQHYSLHNESGANIGEVTSGSESPSTGKLIGMGYVQTAYSKPGTTIWVDIRGKKIPAQVVKLPFYQPQA
ncbi:MAG: glycine cleavage system protein T [Sphingobacteriaceae bacterium]|nr:glycine cleavage system protein T [Sphingobacteriaceae bacterium]